MPEKAVIKGASVRLNQLAVSLNQVELLTPINHEFAAGQWHGVIGPNGGGKSTLLKAIAGLLPHNGEIKIRWQSANEQHIGYMPQIAPFDLSLPVTVMDYLRMNTQRRPLWLSIKTGSNEQQVIEQVGIQSLLNKRLGTLSMGERQRVLLTSALIQTPSLLLLDEPLAGLDKAGQKKMIELFTNFRSQGGTLIMIEHNWHLLAQHSDSLTLIEGGLKQTGTPKELLDSLPQSDQASIYA